MPFDERKTKSGVTVTNKKTGDSFHAASMSDAKKDEKLREAFKHMRENGIPKRGK